MTLWSETEKTIFPLKLCFKYKFQSNLVYIIPNHVGVRICRHEVADVAGLTSFSFGQDEVDRYVMVWKKVLLQDIKFSRTKIMRSCENYFEENSIFSGICSDG